MDEVKFEIRNDWSVFGPLNGEDITDFTGYTLLGSMACALVGALLAAFTLDPVPLIGLLPLVFILLMLRGNESWELKTEIKRDLWHLYKPLPEEIKSKVNLSFDDIVAMTGDEASTLFDRLCVLRNRHNEREALLKQPVVAGILERVDDTIKDYDTYNKTIRNLL